MIVVKRRRVLQSLVACSIPLLTKPAFAREIVRVGQTTGLTGPFGELGSQYTMGIKAAIDEFNASGGPRQIEWISLDDKTDVPTATANAKKLVEEDGVVSVIGTLGTGICKALMPYFEEKKVPFMALTGDDALRKVQQQYTFFSTATYGEEAKGMVRHGATVGLRSVFVIHTDIPAGKGWAEDARQSALENKVEYLGAFAAKPDGSNAAEAVKACLAAKPALVALVLAGNAVKLVLDELLKAKFFPGSIYLLSQGATPKLIETMRNSFYGLVVSQVVPNPFSRLSPSVKEYKAAMQKGGMPLNYLTYQGYLLGRIYTSAMSRVNGTVTSQAMFNVLKERPVALETYRLDYTNSNRSGSHFTDISMLRPDGNFVN